MIDYEAEHERYALDYEPYRRLLEAWKAAQQPWYRNRFFWRGFFRGWVRWMRFGLTWLAVVALALGLIRGETVNLVNALFLALAGLKYVALWRWMERMARA